MRQTHESIRRRLRQLLRRVSIWYLWAWRRSGQEGCVILSLFIYAKRGGVLCWGREQYLWYGMSINLIKSISGYVLNMVYMLHMKGTYSGPNVPLPPHIRSCDFCGHSRKNPLHQSLLAILYSEYWGDGHEVYSSRFCTGTAKGWRHTVRRAQKCGIRRCRLI